MSEVKMVREFTVMNSAGITMTSPYFGGDAKMLADRMCEYYNETYPGGDFKVVTRLVEEWATVE